MELRDLEQQATDRFRNLRSALRGGFLLPGQKKTLYHDEVLSRFSILGDISTLGKCLSEHRVVLESTKIQIESDEGVLKKLLKLAENENIETYLKENPSELVRLQGVEEAERILQLYDLRKKILRNISVYGEHPHARLIKEVAEKRTLNYPLRKPRLI